MGKHKYFLPLRIGVRCKNEYNNSVDVELYYGMREYSSVTMKSDFEEESFREYSDYNQIVSFCFVRKIYTYNSDYTLSTLVDNKDVYSINVKLGDILTTKEYCFSLDNKVVDNIDYSFISNYSSEEHIRIYYYGEIRTMNDEFIKYVYKGDVGIGSYLDLNKDYREIKSICSENIILALWIKDNKLKLSTMSYKE